MCVFSFAKNNFIALNDHIKRSFLTVSYEIVDIRQIYIIILELKLIILKNEEKKIREEIK